MNQPLTLEFLEEVGTQVVGHSSTELIAFGVLLSLLIILVFWRKNQMSAVIDDFRYKRQISKEDRNDPYDHPLMTIGIILTILVFVCVYDFLIGFRGS